MHKPAIGHIYVLEITDGTIKVGYSATPAGRMISHAGAAKRNGEAITRRWISPEHVEAGMNEEALITLCEDLGGKHVGPGRELFSNLRFEDVVSAAKGLTFTAPVGTRRVSSDGFRRDLRDLLDEVAHDEAHIYLLRYDKPAAVIVPVEWYEQMKAQIEAGDEPKESGR